MLALNSLIGSALTSVILSACVLLMPSAVLAGEADVIKAVAKAQGSGSWRFDVTIRSNDKGWDYYCDRFEIVGPDGAVLGTRILAHPHETEQPFTRSLGSVAIPGSVTTVTVRASMKPDGAGGETVQISLPAK